MRAMLVFYMTTDLLYSHDNAYGIYGTYTALVYTTPIIGGLLADRILGDRKAIFFGGILIALGHLSLTFSTEWMFFIGLAFIISGTGLFKANVSALLGKLYQHGDPRRDAGFTLFYVGINLGSFTAALACGWIGKTYGWHYGFGLAAIGMLTGLLFFVRGLPSLEGHGLPPKGNLLANASIFGLNWEQMIYVIAFMLVPIIALMVMNHEHFSYFMLVVGAGVIIYMLYLAFSLHGDERRNILTILVLMFFFMSFFAMFEQIGSSVNFFTELQVDRNFFGWEIHAVYFQSLNPLFIITMGPLFANIWIKLAVAKKEPYTPFKFFMGLLPAALAFGALALSTHYGSDKGLVSMWWVVLAYLLYSLGELCISPVALSMVTKLAPPKLTGVLMGVWLIALAYGNYLAGLLSKLSSVDTNITTATANLATYGAAFTSVTYIGFGVALFMLVLVPFLNGAFKAEEKMKGYNE
jgi:POT family proton-dependent oligopeptide transporter